MTFMCVKMCKWASVIIYFFLKAIKIRVFPIKLHGNKYKQITDPWCTYNLILGMYLYVYVLVYLSTKTHLVIGRICVLSTLYVPPNTCTKKKKTSYYSLTLMTLTLSIQSFTIVYGNLHYKRNIRRSPIISEILHHLFFLSLKRFPNTVA